MIKLNQIRTPRYLEKVDYERFNLETALTFPGNNQHQTKTGMKFSVKDRDVVSDWFNTYFRVEYTFKFLANGANVAAQIKTVIPLNCYSFFEELLDKPLPPMQLEFEFVLQDDDEMIFENEGTGRRIVVRKLELWVPKLQLSLEGQKVVNENFLKPTQWRYL